MAFLTMERLRQLVATDSNGFRLYGGFRAQPICDRLPQVATTGLHKGSILCWLLWLRRARSKGGFVLSGGVTEASERLLRLRAPSSSKHSS